MFHFSFVLSYSEAHKKVSSFVVKVLQVLLINDNKAGYMAIPVMCGWAGVVIEVPRSFGQE